MDRETKIRQIKEEAARICMEERLRVLTNPALAELDRLLKKAEAGDRERERVDRVARNLLNF